MFSTIGEIAEQMQTRALAIGGCVRDALLQRNQSKDIDIVCEGNGIELAKAVADKLPNSGKVSVYKNYGTAMVRIGSYELEFVGARKESYKKNSRNPVVESGTLKDDQKRRDFTVNAIALSRDGRLIDPHGGQDDLEDRVLRHVSPAFSEDPLRVLRCIRFLAQLSTYGFKISTETVDVIKTMSHSLRELSVERIIAELDRILDSTNPAAGLVNLHFLGITETLIPDLSIVPDKFICQSIEARLGEWIFVNQPTLNCIEQYSKKFRLTNLRVDFLTALFKLQNININDAASCLEVMNQLGWLRGNDPDPKLDNLLIEFDQTQLTKVPITRLFEMRNKVREITAAQFTNKGISGKKLGEAIYAERIKVLSTEISAPGTAPGL